MDSFMMSPLQRNRNATPDIQEESPLRHPDVHYDDDIYRGRLLPIHVPEGHDVDQVSTLTSISSSTTSASAHVVRRTLATIVELAILRWARSSSSNGSDSSSSSSAQSGRSRQRHHRRPSISTSVVDTTYIALAREAAERARRVTRGFYLVLPVFQQHDNDESPYHTLQTPSLSLALAQLNTTLRQAHRARRDPMPRYPRAPAQLSSPQIPSSGAQGPDSPIGAPGFRTDTPMKRGRPNPRSKQTPAVLRPSIGIMSWQTGKFTMGKKAWWLDVASPTWDDMRAIGTFLHLHPLTLEDVLHQDPREKLELFPRLGYYLIAFRAIDARSVPAGHSAPLGTGELNVTNVYLAVFREGICSFHFSDISEHVDRVRDRITHQDAAAERMSSDLIALGLMDSIVDAFIPLINSIELEVESVDDLVTGIGAGAESHEGRALTPGDHVPASPTRQVEPPRKKRTSRRASSPNENLDNKESSGPLPTSSATPGWRPAYTIIRWCQRVPSKLKAITRSMPFLKLRRQRKVSSLMQTLLKMSHTRRKVVLLTRLLGPKNEIIGHLRKRLLAGELATQLGDVQDHILTMQHSLAYYERVLSHAHPAYLSFLNVSQSQAKAGSVKAVLWLSCISVGVVCVQVIFGIFSMNVHVPGNQRKSPPDVPIGAFHWFGAVICMEAAVIFAFISAVLRWWFIAKRKFARHIS